MCRFSESGGSCWVKLASETQADETLVALDGSLWEGSRLSVRQATAAEDERSGNLEKRSRSQRLGRSEDVKGEHSGRAFKGRLRMDEEEERRGKRKRAREENTSDKKISLGTDEDCRKRREAWGVTEEDWRKRREAWGL